MFLVVTLVAVAMLCLVHVFVGQLRFLDKYPGIWKSTAAGVGVTYTFLILLPKLGAAQSVLEAATDSGIYGFLVHHAYLVALAGLTLYFGLQAAINIVVTRADGQSLQPLARVLVYSYAIGLSCYYVLVSYLMTEIREAGAYRYISLALFALAMLLHYSVIDHGMRHKYGAVYDPLLRWAFVLASVGGWTLAALTEIPYTAMALLNSFFAGALIAFTFQEEVPEEAHVRFWPFLVGVSCYAVLLLVIEILTS